MANISLAVGRATNLYWNVKFSGTRAQLFKAVEDGGLRFQCIGQMGIPKMARSAASVSGLVAIGAAVGVTSSFAEKKREKQIKRLVKREVAKAAKARQPKGLSFDFFG